MRNKGFCQRRRGTTLKELAVVCNMRPGKAMTVVFSFATDFSSYFWCAMCQIESQERDTKFMLGSNSALLEYEMKVFALAKQSHAFSGKGKSQ